ncbi:MAG: Methylated-DNA--protein-cysteine methyltransferase, constitutive [Planctomycetota bacterium]
MVQTGHIVWFGSDADLRTTLAVFPTSLGWMACCWESDYVAALTFGHANAQLARDCLVRVVQQTFSEASWQREAHYEPTDSQTDLLRRLSDYADGTVDNFRDVRIRLEGMTPFQRKVISCCRKIDWGKTASYGDLARQAGRPGAARAVGSVMAQNRFPLVVPCHRVVGSQGKLCGFSAPDGTAMKRRLLEREGAIDCASEDCSQQTPDPRIDNSVPSGRQHPRPRPR